MKEREMWPGDSVIHLQTFAHDAISSVRDLITDPVIGPLLTALHIDARRPTWIALLVPKRSENKADDKSSIERRVYDVWMGRITPKTPQKPRKKPTTKKRRRSR